MGVFQAGKVGLVAKQAGEAYAQGRQVFVARVNVGMTDPGMSGAVPDAAEIIEAIEAAGWFCAHMAYTQDHKGKPEGYFLFRRRA